MRWTPVSGSAATLYHRRVTKHRAATSWVFGAIATTWLGFAAEAEAAGPKAESIDDQRAYVYLSPAFFAVPLADDDVTDIVDLSYQWGLGVGGIWALGPKDRFGLSVGFAFEHNPATLDDDFENGCDLVNTDCSIHVFRLLPEVRLGGIVNRFFGYGMISPGLGLVYAHYDAPFADDEDTDAGFNLGVGAGGQFMVWRQLYIGGELGFDLGFYTNDEDDFGNDDYQAHTLDFKALVGWYF